MPRARRSPGLSGSSTTTGGILRAACGRSSAGRLTSVRLFFLTIKCFLPNMSSVKIKRRATEVIRHLIFKTGLSTAYVALRAARGANVQHLRSRTLGERFSAIYRNRVWLNDRPSGSLSGLGSELEKTKGIRLGLPGLLASLDTRILLDVGCGDFNWMSAVSLGCPYIGIDVAESVIELNTQRYASLHRSFLAVDATKDPLPRADTALCREVLFHLSFKDIWALIRNLRASGVSRLIATTDPSTDFNADILSGDFRLLNLAKAPFRFPCPDFFIPDDEVSPGRVLAAWRVSSLPIGH